MKSSDRFSGNREILLVTQLASAISILSFLVYLGRGHLLLYGDAVAHINIARRVFDSRTPGPLQLGTVWLPLPHLLMIPFQLSKTLWQTGTGGSIPSMVAYVLSTSGIFRLVRDSLNSESPQASRFAAWLAAGIFALNPNLLYLQSTAMTELVYLAWFIWTVIHFVDFVRDQESRALIRCGWCLVGACLTRYDGWFLAAAICLVAFPAWVRSDRDESSAVWKFLLLALAGPTLWLAYNAAVYRNPLEFANGPYSAKAIERKTAVPGIPAHPGADNLKMAFSFFLKSAEMNVATRNPAERLWVTLLLLGACTTIFYSTGSRSLVVLLVPIPFYTLSVAHGGVPIFLPVWWPHSYYNVRYGVELLPGFAVFLAISICFLLRLTQNNQAKALMITAYLLLVVGSYISIWRQQPICFREAWLNSRDRIGFETELAASLRKLPSNSALLMYVGNHVGALESVGMPLANVINEGNHRPWKKPSDPEGLWERALNNPQQYADFVVASDGDQVATSVNKTGLSSMIVVHSTGEPATTIYWTHRVPGNHPR